ncbi:helix-turn-helix domain-containing protein [Noviherbaspirillum autotrophicum]|uniref:Multidrug DMT transporter permease n=1 Tax=Noviherbaspirillum autotrophicum TaxID=709839 RepID=A0A0C2BQ66_9BURK|nr:multidrug DMT transporter permease [Noviherbaspirillum autotrophicum]
MRTLDLREAADFLKLHHEEVRRRARAGIIPGAKLGKRWGFIEDDLAAYMRSLYAQPRQALQVGHKENYLCHSSNAVKRGGLISPHQAASALDALLKLKTKPRLKSSTIS